MNIEAVVISVILWALITILFGWISSKIVDGVNQRMRDREQ